MEFALALFAPSASSATSASARTLSFGRPATIGEDYYATGFEGFGDGRHALGKAEGGWYGTSDGGASWSQIFSHNDLKCTGYPNEYPPGNRTRCEAGNEKHDGYTYVYNEGRGTPSAKCGPAAGCWCCRCLNSSACTVPHGDPFGDVGATVLSADGGTLHNLGSVTAVADRDGKYFAFNSSYADFFIFSDDLPISFTGTRKNVSVVFRGLPAPATCGNERHAFGCPFRTGGRGSVRLADGTLVMSIIVYWGGAHANPNPKLAAEATSVVAFRSADGFEWEYAGTILDAATAHASEEGPNENDLAMLDDGTTILCVCRLDAGDGPLTRPYVPYVALRSTDGGRTWSAPVSLGEGVGCARPRLLSMPAGGIVLAGGRLSPTNRDIIMWSNAAGDGVAWKAHSISYQHNLLEPNASLHFDKAVNASTARESTSYTSLVRRARSNPLSRSRMESKHSTRAIHLARPSQVATSPTGGFIVYARHLPPSPDVAFAMPFTLA